MEINVTDRDLESTGIWNTKAIQTTHSLIRDISTTNTPVDTKINNKHPSPK